MKKDLGTDAGRMRISPYANRKTYDIILPYPIIILEK